MPSPGRRRSLLLLRLRTANWRAALPGLVLLAATGVLLSFVHLGPTRELATGWVRVTDTKLEGRDDGAHWIVQGTLRDEPGVFEEGMIAPLPRPGTYVCATAALRFGHLGPSFIPVPESRCPGAKPGG